jgi:predicted DsbA family dithiol-disulfide isomerase
MIVIDYFTDVLCVWAWGGQVRLDQLRATFGTRLCIRERFIPLFADTQSKIGEGWADRDGFAGFCEHTHHVCDQWDHVQLHPTVWRDCRPASSHNPHLFLKAVALCHAEQPTDAHQAMIARLRQAFFEAGQDIGDLRVLMDLLGNDDPPADMIKDHLDSGRAAALLQRDAELAQRHSVRGSPTYLFNEGRQILYGNVGYRIIEANLNELLSGALRDGEPSWC